MVEPRLCLGCGEPVKPSRVIVRSSEAGGTVYYCSHTCAGRDPARVSALFEGSGDSNGTLAGSQSHQESGGDVRDD
jgi:hypothetical protein